MLIADAKKTIRRQSGVSIVCTFLNADFEGVSFYAARRYLNLTREVREEDFLVSDK